MVEGKKEVVDGEEKATRFTISALRRLVLGCKDAEEGAADGAEQEGADHGTALIMLLSFFSLRQSFHLLASCTESGILGAVIGYQQR